MSATEIWALAIVLIILAAGLSFYFGRRTAAGSSAEIAELTALYETQLSNLQSEFDAYRQSVHTHNEKTASLFVSMAAPYREMFDHLSEGYEKLGHDSDQPVLPKRAGALLDGPDNITPAPSETIVPDPELPIDAETDLVESDHIEVSYPKDYVEPETSPFDINDKAKQP